MSQPQTQPTIILQVALPSPLRRSFDYLPPAELAVDHVWQPGQRLLVPFGRRQLVGILLGTSTDSDYLDKLRPALACLDAEPILPPHLLELAVWAANYYLHPVGDALTNWLPTLLRQGEPARFRSLRHWQAVPTPEPDIPSNAAKQQALWSLLNEHPQGLSSIALKTFGFNSSHVKTLVDKGLVHGVDAEPEARPFNATTATADLLRHPALSLHPEQQQALDAITAKLGHYQPFLLQGVTGSGKTEVYLQLITRVLEQGQQALVLVPEIGLTPQMVRRFEHRFNVPIAVLHSGLNDRERLDGWLQAQRGEAAVLIGTRSSVLTPLANPGVIIIDEEHDGSFKQQDSCRYSARDMAVMRARAENIPIVLGSATPSLESLINVQRQRYQWLPMDTRAGNASTPDIELVDICHQSLENGLCEQVLTAMTECLERQEQVLVFLNRRGFAPVLMCHDCGWQADCGECDAHLTLHRNPPHLHCHHCDYQRAMISQCPHCQSRNLKPIGAGTERTESTLQAHFPDTDIIRVDRDSTRRKEAMHNIIDQVHRSGPCILVGTQMLAKGHHFPKVTLVVIVDADAGLFSADFRGMEKMSQLLLQVAGRSGRAERPGRVLMQTLNADHPKLQCLIDKGYTRFAEQELAERQMLELPPFNHYILLRAEALARGRAEAFLKVAEQLLLPYCPPEVRLLGPLSAPMEKRAGRFRAQLLLQSAARAPLHNLCRQLTLQLEGHKLAQKVRWSLDVDPLDMF